MTDYDLVIAGGGLVGASLAAALDGTGLRVAVAEAATPGAPGQPSFDERQTALAPSSQRFFSALGLWPAIAAEAAPIRSIHVSEQGMPSMVRLHAADEGLDALGYVVPNRVLGAVLQPAMESAAEVIAPARITAAEVGTDAVTLTLEGENGRRSLSSRLLAVADGGGSPLCAMLGIRRRVRDYEQTAVIAGVRTERPGQGWAYERFTPEGPLAMLPAGQGRHALVWTLPRERAEAIAGCPEPAFLTALQDAFGWRLGRLQAVGERYRYPLRAVTAERFVAPRAVILGNAAHTLHPVAGQGFNLALRDVADLAERVGSATDTGARDCSPAMRQRGGRTSAGPSRLPMPWCAGSPTDCPACAAAGSPPSPPWSYSRGCAMPWHAKAWGVRVGSRGSAEGCRWR
ncbi:MAG: FAD-dependent monooxygenase [Arhodomonas sp.]|nr:FAD-dependent monooxygenase [Arhodomonas sp.]